MLSRSSKNSENWFSAGWDLTPEQETHVLKVLFELFDTFLAEREGAASES
ncbi:hypothetical protein [Kitasatospora camelliae]|uniref:Uncharacterized protein n=1 Tax=Kitasatospora camelliae TaxID=3156397 RepID=A0AAU8K6M8_9ACTN